MLRIIPPARKDRPRNQAWRSYGQNLLFQRDAVDLADMTFDAPGHTGFRFAVAAEPGDKRSPGMNHASPPVVRR